MGLGWIKSEERIWGASGPRESGTWDYKPPMHLDIPKNFSLILTNQAPEFENQPNDNYPGMSEVIYRSYKVYMLQSSGTKGGAYRGHFAIF